MLAHSFHFHESPAQTSYMIIQFSVGSWFFCITLLMAWISSVGSRFVSCTFYIYMILRFTCQRTSSI